MSKFKAITLVASFLFALVVWMGLSSPRAQAYAPAGITLTPTVPDRTVTVTETTITATPQPRKPRANRPTATPQGLLLPVTGDAPPGPTQSILWIAILLAGAAGLIVGLVLGAGRRWLFRLLKAKETWISLFF